METFTFSALLAICTGISPVPGDFPAQRPVTRSFDVFFDLSLNKRLSKQSGGWWFETLWRPLWRHRNVPRLNSNEGFSKPPLNGWLTILHNKICMQSISHVITSVVSAKSFQIRQTYCYPNGYWLIYVIQHYKSILKETISFPLVEDLDRFLLLTIPMCTVDELRSTLCTKTLLYVWSGSYIKQMPLKHFSYIKQMPLEHLSYTQKMQLEHLSKIKETLWNTSGRI